MSMQSIPKKVDMRSKDMASFLEPRTPSKMDIFKGIQTSLEKAIDEPDRRAPSEPIPIRRAVQDEAPSLEARIEAPQHVQAPQHVEAPPQDGGEAVSLGSKAAGSVDETSMQIVVDEAPKQKKAPGKNMVEKTFSIDKDQYKLLVRMSNLEGLRLEKNVATSEILRHLLDFALAHADVKTGEVLTVGDGKGLKVPERRAGQ